MVDMVADAVVETMAERVEGAAEVGA